MSSNWVSLYAWIRDEIHIFRSLLFLLLLLLFVCSLCKRVCFFALLEIYPPFFLYNSGSASSFLRVCACVCVCIVVHDVAKGKLFLLVALFLLLFVHLKLLAIDTSQATHWTDFFLCCSVFTVVEIDTKRAHKACD